ncbi:MAG: OmpA family protein, partial [Woeseia sp.]
EGKLTVAGETSSTGHAEILHAVVANLYPDANVEWRLENGQTTPPGWSLVSEQTLRTLAMTRSGEATLSDNELHLRGVHDDPASWQIAIGALERTLLPGMRLQNDVVVFDDRLSFAELCQQQFQAALRDRSVQFAQTRSDLSPAAQPLLDALVEITADCPASRLVVTGHTDGSTAEADSNELSLQRARAVTDYITRRGIARARLSVAGAGSTVPLDAANTRAARALNRRVEFRLLIAE